MAFTNFYNKRVFCDMDGVLCDFVAQWMRMTKTNMLPKDFEAMYGKDEFYAELSKYGQDFWETMPWTTDGVFLWNYIDKYKPIILSTPTLEESCRLGKEKWVKRNLPTKTELILTENKENWADPFSILIDDKGSNVRRFIIAEGNGIIHTSSVETIRELKEKFGM